MVLESELTLVVYFRVMQQIFTTGLPWVINLNWIWVIHYWPCCQSLSLPSWLLDSVLHSVVIFWGKPAYVISTVWSYNCSWTSGWGVCIYVGMYTGDIPASRTHRVRWAGFWIANVQTQKEMGWMYQKPTPSSQMSQVTELRNYEG